jgi:hypothetical protein
MIAYDFCKNTKLHLDSILSTQHSSIDVSIIIDILQSTIDFEYDLHKRFTNSKSNGADLNPDELPTHGVTVGMHLQ